MNRLGKDFVPAIAVSGLRDDEDQHALGKGTADVPVHHERASSVRWNRAGQDVSVVHPVRTDDHPYTVREARPGSVTDAPGSNLLAPTSISILTTRLKHPATGSPCDHSLSASVVLRWAKTTVFSVYRFLLRS